MSLKNEIQVEMHLARVIKTVILLAFIGNIISCTGSNEKVSESVLDEIKASSQKGGNLYFTNKYPKNQAYQLYEDDNIAMMGNLVADYRWGYEVTIKYKLSEDELLKLYSDICGVKLTEETILNLKDARKTAISGKNMDFLFNQ